MSNRYIVILAAGQGTRMKSNYIKYLHPVCGKPMVQPRSRPNVKYGCRLKL